MSRPITQRRVLWELALGGPRDAMRLGPDILARYGPGIVTAWTSQALAALVADNLVSSDRRGTYALSAHIGPDERASYEAQAIRAAVGARARLAADARRHLEVVAAMRAQIEAELLGPLGALCAPLDPREVARRRIDLTRAFAGLEATRRRRAHMDSLPGAERVAAVHAAVGDT